MGIFTRFFGFVWRRWADWQSIQALYDLLDIKLLLASLCGGGVVLTWAAYDNWTPLGVWLAACGFAAFIAIIYIAVRLHRALALGGKVSSAGPVSRALIPQPTTLTATRDTGLSEAIAYLCFRQWGKSFMDAAASSEVDGATEYDNFLQAAADGTIPIWGRRENYSVYEPIPNNYWFQNRFDWFALLKGKPNSESSQHAFSGDRYLSLMTSKAAVEQQWPASA